MVKTFIVFFPFFTLSTFLTLDRLPIFPKWGLEATNTNYSKISTATLFGDENVTGYKQRDAGYWLLGKDCKLRLYRSCII